MDYNKETVTARDEKAYAGITALFDPQTFVELGKHEKASVICGYGAVNDALTFAFAQDNTDGSASLGGAEVKKISELYAMAEKSGAPIVGFFSGAGARVGDGSKALADLGKLLSSVSGVSGKVVQIAVIEGVCSGIGAVAASLFDVVIASEGASWYINPPTVTRAQGDKDAGSVKKAFENGNVDIVCPDADSAAAAARDILAILPQNNAQGLAYADAGDPSERETPELESAKSAKEIIEAVADSGSFRELKGGCADGAVIGLASVGSVTTGIAATEGAKSLTPAAARKIASFVSFCDNYRIPLLTLVDTKGIDRSVDSENAAFASELARLAEVYSASTNAKVTLVTGKAYGAAFTLLGSKAVGADIVYALPKAEISVMEPDAAVQFLYGDTIKSAEDPAKERADVTAKYKAESASAQAAAVSGVVDDVVDYAEARARVISAFNMLWTKAEGTVFRRHTKLPF